MRHYDAIVVGAGPAGSTAALHLARAGASVLLLDRARFPRDKPCGGGLTYRAVNALPVRVDPVVEDTVSHVEVAFRGRRLFERTSRTPLVLMTQRRRLDAYLAEQAVTAGAEFRDGVRVTALSVSRRGAEVVAAGERLSCSVVLGADGVNGMTARAIGGARYTHGVALEGNASYQRVAKDRYRGRLVLELGSIPGGYAWVFPKGDHVNFGVGGWEREGPHLRAQLERFCGAHGVAADQLENTRGYRLPLRSASSPLAQSRLALIGDAAGLVDPLSGDGIYEAAVSAGLASEAALDVIAGRAQTMDPYAAAVLRALGRLHIASWRAKRALDRFPRLTLGVVRLPPVWRAVENLLRGELTSPADARGLSRGPLRLVEALGRSTAPG